MVFGLLTSREWGRILGSAGEEYWGGVKNRHPCPTVSWAELRFKPSLPKPGHYPVYGVVQDPSFYKGGWNNGWVGPFYQPHPFGSLPGYRTNLGVVPVPTLPAGGYVWADEEWVLHATWAGDDGPSSRRRSQPWRSRPRPPRRAQGG